MTMLCVKELCVTMLRERVVCEKVVCVTMLRVRMLCL